MHGIMRNAHETSLLGHFEHHVEVLGLRSPYHVEEVVATESLDTVDYAGEVCGGVVVTTVRLRDDYWHGLALPVDPATRVHHTCALALLQQATLVQPLHYNGKQVVIARLTHDVVSGQQHPQHLVDLVEVAH